MHLIRQKRPWKNLIAIHYLNQRTYIKDSIILILTIISPFKRKFSLKCIAKLLNIKKDTITYGIVTRQNDLKDFKINPPISDIINKL